MNGDHKECLSRIKSAFEFYLSLQNTGFKGQINIEVNCLDGKIISTSIFVHRGAKKKNIDHYQKMHYIINDKE